MDSLNIDQHSKALAFKKFKLLLYKYYPKFVKTFKKHPNKFDIRQLLLLLRDIFQNIKDYCSIERLLKNVNILQGGTGKNPTILLYSDKKSENFLNKKNLKITKRENAFKSFASTYNVEIVNSSTMNYNLKRLNLH